MSPPHEAGSDCGAWDGFGEEAVFLGAQQLRDMFANARGFRSCGVEIKKRVGKKL